MKSNNQLSDVLHVLLHLAQTDVPLTSEALASAINTNPVVLRRLMAGLRKAGFVASEKGHGGGWLMAAALDSVTLRDVHLALGAPALVSLGFREEHPGCLVAQAVNTSLRTGMQEAEALLLKRLESITLADLSREIGPRMKAYRLENHHGHH